MDEHYLYIEVVDSGIGIPREEQAHLFERFFRANNALHIQGTGLGLNIVKKYVDMVKGEIMVESEENKGSSFRLKIPLGRAIQNIIAMKKILLIEDNAEVRESTAEILELADYKVLTAADGKTGVEIAKKASLT